MTRQQPPPTTIRLIEFELEKAEHGLAMPYDAERVVAQHAPRGAQAKTVCRAKGKRGRGSPMTAM
jgi:hypothetical protein